EDQVHSAAMDVEFGTQIGASHRRAFQMPAGASAAPRCGPGGFAGLGRLPQGEVALIAFAGGRAFALMNVVDLVAGQLPVLRVAEHVEVDITAGGIRVIGFDQAFHQLDHLGDVAGGPRLGRRWQDVQGVVGGGKGAFVGGRPFPPWPARRGGLGEDLVVDVGDVADEGDVAAARDQPAAQDVEGHAAADVADVRKALDGGATQVDGDVALAQRNEITHSTGCRVV